MRVRYPIALCAFTLTMAALVSQAGEIVDRIVATVNGQIILQSDWEDAIRYEAFVAKRSLSAVSSIERKAALDHLIDQELLREQVRAPDSVQPSKREVEDQIKEVRKQYGEANSDAEWKALLAAHRLTEAELQRRVMLQLELARLVDVHLRPAANISSKNIESYYRQELLPQLRQAGAQEVPLAEISPKIKELLTQRRINELLATWLQTLHAGSEIHTQLYSSGEGLPQ